MTPSCVGEMIVVFVLGSTPPFKYIPFQRAYSRRELNTMYSKLNSMTHQIFDTTDDPSGTSHEIYIFLLEPRGYIPAIVGPCASESTCPDCRVDGVGRRSHTKRLEYALVDKVHVAHASQLVHDIRANYVHLPSTLSRRQHRGSTDHTSLLYWNSSRNSYVGRRFRRFLVKPLTVSCSLYDWSFLRINNEHLRHADG